MQNKTQPTISVTTVKPIAIVLVGNGAGNISRRSKGPIFEKAVALTKAINPDLIEWITLNTEKRSLDALNAIVNPSYSLLLGPKLCQGNGAGFDRTVGAAAFAESKDELKQLFADDDGKSKYSGAIIVHSELKGTGGGVALLLGKMLRDELGMGTVLFQSIRPTTFEASAIQGKNAHDVVEEILAAGFNTLELDNQVAWDAASDDAQLEDVHRLLDQDTVRAWLAMGYVLLNPGSADVADFNRQILSQGKGGKRMVASYMSFPIPSKNATAEKLAQMEHDFKVGLEKLLDFWGFHFNRDVQQMLVVTHGHKFWNMGRIKQLQSAVQNFAETKISDPELRKNFFPIFGGQDSMDKTSGRHAFVAVMASGPEENEAYEKFRGINGESAVKLPRPIPAPIFSAPASLAPVSKPNSTPEYPNCTKKQRFLLDRLSELKTSKAANVLTALESYTPEYYFQSYESSLGDDVVSTPEGFERSYSEFILTLFAQAHQFEREEYLRVTSGAQMTLKAGASLHELRELVGGAFELSSKELIKNRIAYHELFGEELVKKFLVPAIPVPKHQPSPNGTSQSVAATKA